MKYLFRSGVKYRIGMCFNRIFRNNTFYVCVNDLGMNLFRLFNTWPVGEGILLRNALMQATKIRKTHCNNIMACNNYQLLSNVNIVQSQWAVKMAH